MRLDDWVLCRIYRKRHVAKTDYKEEGEEEEEALQPPISLTNTPKTEYKEEQEDQHHHQQQMYNLPRTFSLAHLLEFNYLGSISHLLNDNPTSPPSIDFQENNSNDNMGTSGIFGPNGFDREDAVWY
uniref:Putative NAC domain class transcription factor n=1 Tax=Tamarix hispida TaxID=189793 RepID=T2C9Z1_9CARY|nr:putative NAC domain class transcription factor [Tamarix hispida]